MANMSIEAGQHRELVATLPGRTSREYLAACKEAGMRRVRIHTGKMDPEGAARLILNCHAVGLPVSCDMGGKKPRVLKSHGMTEVEEGPEKGNWLKTLKTGETMLLTSQEGDDAHLLADATLPGDVFVCRLSCLPQVFSGDGHELINFSDGEISCRVERVLKDDRKITGIIAAVESVQKVRGLFWNMGVISPTNDIFSGDDPALIETDMAKLRKIMTALNGDCPEEVAVSFVSTKNHVLDAQKKLQLLGIKATILAKIETVRGVDEIEEIVQADAKVEVARGDLSEALKASGKYTLLWAEAKIIAAARQAGREVVVATHVADSLLTAARERQVSPGDRLTKAEQVAVCLEFPETQGWMLAAETMVTGDSAEQIIRATNRSIKAAERYWRRWRT